MEPGRELDRLVAEAMGWNGLFNHPQTGELYGQPPNSDPDENYVPILEYSTEDYAVMITWEWLEKNNPWRPAGKHPGEILLSRYYRDSKPSVIVLRTYYEDGVQPYEEVKDYPETNFAITGESYPHAICLAVLATKEAGNVQG